MVHRETFPIRFFEADANGNVTAASLVRFAHSAADGHCRLFGLSLHELLAENKTWIITRFRLQMERYPQSGEAVTVETWASSRTNGIRAVREFCFVDESGESVGRAAGIFLMMDLARKRPARLPQVVDDMVDAERSDPEEFEIPRLRALGRVDGERRFVVGWKELDANGHANNVSYLEWALDAAPLEWNRDGLLRQLDLEFLAEAFYGHEVTSRVEVGEGECGHQLVSGGGVTLGLGRSLWVRGARADGE